MRGLRSRRGSRSRRRRRAAPPAAPACGNGLCAAPATAARGPPRSRRRRQRPCRASPHRRPARRRRRWRPARIGEAAMHQICSRLTGAGSGRSGSRPPPPTGPKPRRGAGSLQQLQAESGIADGAADIEPVAGKRASAQHRFSLRHEAERGDGDGQEDRAMAEVSPPTRPMPDLAPASPAGHRRSLQATKRLAAPAAPASADRHGAARPWRRDRRD